MDFFYEQCEVCGRLDQGHHPAVVDSVDDPYLESARRVRLNLGVLVVCNPNDCKGIGSRG